MFTLSPLSNAGSPVNIPWRYSTTELSPFRIHPSLVPSPVTHSFKVSRNWERREREGEKERRKKIRRVAFGCDSRRWESKFGAWAEGEGARNGPFTRVYMRRHWNIGFATDAHHIRGKIFQRLSTSARVHAASSNAPQRALPQDFHPCQTYATSVFSIRTYSLAFLFFLLPLFSLSSSILSRGNSNLPLFSPFLLFSFRDSTPDFDFDFSNKQRRKMKSAPTIGDWKCLKKKKENLDLTDGFNTRSIRSRVTRSAIQI